MNSLKLQLRFRSFDRVAKRETHACDWLNVWRHLLFFDMHFPLLTSTLLISLSGDWLNEMFPLLRLDDIISWVTSRIIEQSLP